MTSTSGLDAEASGLYSLSSVRPRSILAATALDPVR